MKKPLYLEEAIAPLFRKLNWSLALAESCTGGLISHRVTNISGASDYYHGGINAYTNEVKNQLLDVKSETLEKYGAVSEPTVRQMAEGAKSLLHSDVAVSVSGIAGPSGGTPQKPVGTVWIGLALPHQTDAFLYHFHGDRLSIKNQTAENALWLLYKALVQQVEQSSLPFQSTFYVPLEVDFKWDEQNLPKAVSFKWQDREVFIISHGRQWHDQAGLHFLVMDAHHQVFELLYQNDGCWFIHPPQDIRNKA
ncbi:MAG: CinA family protein [Anaerolineales bacterium]